MAVDCREQYRPQENPADGHIQDDAGGAVGTLRRLSGMLIFLPRPPQRPGPFKAALNAFIAEARVLTAPWAKGGLASLNTASTCIEPRPTGISKTTGGRTS